MPLASVISEAWRNVCVGTTRALTFALALATGLGVLAWADVGSAAASVEKVHAYVSAGASTYTIVSESNIHGTRCHQLTTSSVSPLI